jgi:hypothetical protein
MCIIEKITNSKYLFKDYSSSNCIFLRYVITESRNISNNEYKNAEGNDILNGIFNSGSSVNITKSFNLLSNIQTINEKIALPNGKLISSTIRGHYLTSFINDNKITLKNIYYVPNIAKNIISVTQLIKQHYKIIFFNHNNKMYCTIYNQHLSRIVNIYPNNQNIFNIWRQSKGLNFREISTPNMAFMHLSRLSKVDRIDL